LVAQKPGTDHTNDLVRQIAAEEAFSKKKKLGPQQILALKCIRNFPGKGKKRVVLQDLTGFGKTLIGAKITEGALAKSIGCFLRFRPSL
jgi:superfamily II DNA or RNA helicase